MGCSSSNTGHSGSKSARVVMIGLNKAGKTQVLYFLKMRQPVQTIPTIGFNAETVPGPKGYQFTIFDVGGDARLRPLWKNYYPNTEAVIFVVDSADRERLQEAKEALFGELSNRDLRGVPILVLANKTDLPGALTPTNVQEGLHLKAIIDRTWALDPVSGLTGQGLDVATSDLVRLIQENRRKRSSASKNTLV